MKRHEIREFFRLGGKGSGHHGHKGVPGQCGGSAPRGGGGVPGEAPSGDIFVGWDPSTWKGRGTSLDAVGKAIEGKFDISRPFQPSSDRMVYTRVDEGKLRGVRDGLKSGGFFYVGRGKARYLTDGSTNVEVDVGKGRLVLDQSP